MTAIFDARTMDGYYVRNALSLIKSETTVATALVDKKYLTISFETTKKPTADKNCKTSIEALVQYFIRFDLHRNFPGYIYNSSQDQESFSFLTVEMAKVTKGITKTDGVRLYRMEGEDNLEIRVLKARTNNPNSFGASHVPLIKRQDLPLTRTFIFPEEYDATMPVKEFSERCNKAVSHGCKYMTMSYKNGMMSFKGIMGDGTVSFDEPYITSSELMDEDETAGSDQDEVIANPASPVNLVPQLGSLSLGLNPLSSLGSGLGSRVLSVTPMQEAPVPAQVPRGTNELVIHIPNTLCKVYAKHSTLCCNINESQEMRFDYVNQAMNIRFHISVTGEYETTVTN